MNRISPKFPNVAYLYMVLAILSLEALSAAPLVVQELSDLRKLSQQVQSVLPASRSVTVCIDLGDGSTGSGVIVSADGLVLSAAHVTQEVGKEFTVILEDGTEYPAVGLGLDTTNDAAMAQIILPDGVDNVPFSSQSTELAIGQYVFSLGHSGGFDLERGIVLRLGRITELSSASLVTDCALIGGDSGGALFDLQGRLVAIHSRVGTVTNSNTHVPLRVYQDQWESLQGGELKGDGTFANAGFPFIGMHLLERDEMLQVSSVMPGSRADGLGVQVGDYLLGINGEAIATPVELVSVLKSLKLDDKGGSVALEFQRGQERMTINYHFDE